MDHYSPFTTTAVEGSLSMVQPPNLHEIRQPLCSLKAKGPQSCRLLETTKLRARTPVQGGHRRSRRRRRPHQQPGKNLQSREEMLFLLRILIFSFKKNRMTELFLYLFLYDAAVNFYCCDGAFDGKLFMGHLNASSSVKEKMGSHQTSGASRSIKEKIACFCTA